MASPSPPRRSIPTREARFFLDGHKWRWETEGPTWVNRVESVIPELQVASFDGTEFRTFTGIEWPDSDFAHPLGWISLPKLAHRQASNPHLSPVLLLYRPLESAYGLFDPLQWSESPAARRERLGDMDCIAITFTNKGNSRLTKKCWVSPALDYAVVRYEPARTIQVEIEYERVDGWVVPKSWRRTFQSRDGLRDRAKITVTN